MIKRTNLGLTLAALGLGLLLTACGGGQEPVPAQAAVPTQPPVEVQPAAPTAAPVAEPTIVEKEEPVAAEVVADSPTLAPEPEVVAPEPVDWLTTVTVDGDYYILGNPAAAVRLLDYSDFL